MNSCSVELEPPCDRDEDTSHERIAFPFAFMAVRLFASSFGFACFF
jgi:hypothetical protein